MVFAYPRPGSILFVRFSEYYPFKCVYIFSLKVRLPDFCGVESFEIVINNDLSDYFRVGGSTDPATFRSDTAKST